MATTQEMIQEWFERGKEMGATHMIVVCDTLDYEDYPTYVLPNEDPRAKYNDIHGKNMQTVMKVYDLRKDMNEQLNRSRCFEF